MNNSLLYFVHLCMRGKDDVLGGELFKGTSKSAEGHAASRAFGKAKEEGLHIEVQWQDGDSSSANAFREHYPDKSRSKVMLCGGHSTRAHNKKMGELAKQKCFSATIQDRYREKFPEHCQVSLPKKASQKVWVHVQSLYKGSPDKLLLLLTASRN